jgi:hypothetical protein
MNYAAFKAYLATFLWKQNDAELIANLDNLILMANHELNRSLNIERRNVTAIIAPTTEDFVLPSDFRQMNSLVNLTLRPGITKEMLSTTLSDIYQLRVQTQSNIIVPGYAVDESAGVKYLRLVGPFSVSEPGSFMLSYKANVPNYAVTNTSWLATDFLDLYTYHVLSHTAPFLREDERLEVWQAMKGQTLMTAIDEDLREVKFGGSPLKMRPHSTVPTRRSRR